MVLHLILLASIVVHARDIVAGIFIEYKCIEPTGHILYNVYTRPCNSSIYSCTMDHLISAPPPLRLLTAIYVDFYIFAVD